MHKSKINKRNDCITDVYWKDFKHLTPSAIRNYSRGKSRKYTFATNITLKSLFVVWVKEVVLGLKKFFYEGSLHGVKYIFEPTFTRKERITWILIVGISIGFCIANIVQLFSKWTSTPFVNVMDSLPTPVWGVPFPSVVVCPLLHVKLSYANVSKLDDQDSFFASLMCPQMSRLKKSLPKRLDSRGHKRLEKFILEASPKCSEVVKKCYWGSADGDSWMSEDCCSKIFKPIFTNYGLCYAFNTLPLNGMSNITESWHYTFDSNPDAGDQSWSLDEGYNQNFNINDHPYRAMAAGEQYGFGAELFLNSSEHQYLCDGNSKGFMVIIESPSDHVYTSTVLRLPMEMMTSVEVSPKTYKTDSELRKLAPQKRQCFFQNERKLRYYALYTDSNCKQDLLVSEVRKNCKCVAYNWPRPFLDDAVCSTKREINCYNAVKDRVEQELILSYFSESEGGNSQSSPETCYPSCNDIMYSSQVFYSEIRDVSRDFGMKVGDMATINVHFYEDMFLGLHRHTQYDDYYFVGAIGGLLSLFLGFSIISMAELLYFIILRPFQCVFSIMYNHTC